MPTSEPISDLNGLLPVYKPPAMSSFQVIREFKKTANFKGKIGHAGTLDVFAEGLLILMLGQATKQFDSLQTQEKTYVAGVRLGYSSSTLDTEGDLTPQIDSERPSLVQIVGKTAQFLGEQQQNVPIYSAAKQDGQPLYKLARAGQKIKPKSKTVNISSLRVLGYTYPLVSLEVSCSSGTYIRQLSYDLFKSLQLESYLFSLRRTAIGNLKIEQACSIDHFSTQKWSDFVLKNE